MDSGESLTNNSTASRTEDLPVLFFADKKVDLAELWKLKGTSEQVPDVCAMRLIG